MTKIKTNTTKATAEAKPPAAQFPDQITVTIDVPTWDTGLPVLSRLDGKLTQRQARALRAIFDGLCRDGETVQLGAEHPVKAHMDAVRWLLDRVADEIAQEEPAAP
jgi:hypothetical protein